MSRLPPQLQPLWPAVKCGHRYGARVVGAVARRTGGPWRGLPSRGSSTSRATLAAEPRTTRLHSVGAPFVVRRPMPDGDPPGLRYFADRLAHMVPERYVLELDGGLLLGRHAAVVTAGRRLDLETSHYFDIRSWHEHPVFWNPWPADQEYVDGTVAVLATRGTGHNYYHFLMDALPRLGLLERAFPGFAEGRALVRPDAWVVDRSTRYQQELLALLGVDGPRLIEPRPGMALRARTLLVPSLPNVSTLASPETTAWLREHLPPRRLEGRPELLYVTRGRTPNTRRVVQEEELLERLARRGFVAIDPGALSVQEQIDHFAAARVVVAPHGAALTNLSFCRPGVRVLELFAPGYLNGGYWSIVANVPDARYRYLVGRGPAPRADRQVGVMHDIDIDPDQVERALDALLAS